MAKISRNDLCPCGSGKKFKKCCESTKLNSRISVLSNNDTQLQADKVSKWLFSQKNPEITDK